MSLKDMVPFGKKGSSPAQYEQNPFSMLRRELDSIFDRFFQGVDAGAFEERTAGFVPRLDMRENEKEIFISAELPGMAEKDIEVTINREALTIRGEKKEEREEKGKGFYRTERSYGSFSRTIPLPAEIDDEKVSASFNKGVLTITLPKAAQIAEEGRKISVKVE